MPTATLPKTGSLASFMDALEALHENVHPDLRVYRWRPRSIELPAIYCWIAPSPFEQRDLARFRDNLNLLVRVAIRQSDVNEEMAAVEEYADAYRAVVDDALHANRPLDGAATWAIRSGMSTVLDSFGEIDALCVEFTIAAHLDRRIDPNP